MKGILAAAALAAATFHAGTSAAGPAPAGRGAGQAPAPDVIVYASALPRGALSEFEFWADPGSPGGKLVGTPNDGGNLDPPPENDPHVRVTARVRAGVAYRCWIRMKVGPPKGQALANRLWVQFSTAVDAGGQPTLRPGTGSYLTAQGPTRQGWTWVGCNAGSAPALVRFASDGDVTVRLQAGMEGVGFDQLVLSPARFLDSPPSVAVVQPQERP
jgi:hypothetical protein